MREFNSEEIVRIRFLKGDLSRLTREEQLFFIRICNYYPGLDLMDGMFSSCRASGTEDFLLIRAAVHLRFAADYLYRGWMMLAQEFSDPQFLNMIRRGISGEARKDLLHLQKYFSDGSNSIVSLLKRFSFDSPQHSARIRNDIIKKGEPVLTVFQTGKDDYPLISGAVYNSCTESGQEAASDMFEACLEMAEMVRDRMTALISECINLFQRRMNCTSQQTVKQQLPE